MNEILKNIIITEDFVEESVLNIDLLLEMTRKVDSLSMDKIHWEKIRHLHFLGSADHPDMGQLRYGRVKPGCYLDKEEETWLLVVGAPTWEIQGYLYRCGPALEVLTLRFVSMEEVNLSHLGNLKELDISSNSQLRNIRGLERLTELTILDLGSTRMGPVLDLNPHPRLQRLSISRTPIQTILLDRPMEELESFGAMDSEIQDADFLRWFPALRRLSLKNAPIQRLPEEMPALDQMEFVDLSELSLEDLPDWFPELLQKVRRLYLYDITVRGVEPGFLEQPRAVILKWFEERRKARSGAALNEVKVVFLGDGEAGKSHTIARLLNDGGDPVGFNGDATPGIVITHRSYDIGGRRVQVHFWDFGGQEILHSMHRMFLTKRTLYVIVLNARDDTQDDRARYWLHNVRSFAGDAPVLLALNKMDQNPNASVNETDLGAICSGKKEVVKLSAMYDDQEKFNMNFTEAMKRQIGAMTDLDYFFPASWTKAKERLLSMTENYISGSDFAAICDECGVTDEGDLRKNLLNWFHDLGVSICYGGHARLKDYVILRPNWITNAVYAVLYNRHPTTQNGIISHEAIFEMIQPPREGRDLYRRTNSEEIYTQQEIEFVLNVMRKFWLSFRVDDEREFVPALCQRNTPRVAADYAGDPDALEFHMIFSYLPGNVLHRLMVELRQNLDTTQVWRTGAHFIQKSSGLSAVVKSEGSTLKFFVRSAREPHRASTYLCILKDAVDSIVRAMNLNPPKNEVVYKLDGRCQSFDYDDLVDAQRCGMTHMYSGAHRRPVRIDDILYQTGRGPEKEWEQLLRDIVEGCGMLRGNMLNWNVREDVRNTYMRDLLRMKGYRVSDQTLIGRSAGGKQAGELDLEIRRGDDGIRTIYEALNLSGSQVEYWNRHLCKLLNDYNVNDLHVLFLVSYVDASRDAFNRIWMTFSEHLRFYSPTACRLQFAEILAPGTEQSQGIQAARCVYDCDGTRMTVYHLFVRMGA